MSRLSFARATVLTLLIAGCQTVPPAPEPSREIDARARIEAGDYRAAGTEFERLAAEQRGLRDYYKLKAAEAWREEGSFEDVSRLLGEIKRKKLNGEQNLRLDLLAAELALSKQQAAQALTLLGGESARIPEPLRERWLELKARAYSALGRTGDAARTRLALLPLLQPSEVRDAERDLFNLIAAEKPERLRADLAPMAADDPLRPWLERALRAAGEVPARATIAPTEAVGTMMAGTDGAMQREGFRAIGQLAVLLPMSGEYAAAGKAILDGVMSAHFTTQAARSVRIYDVGGTRRSALDAYRAALKDGAEAIVGPVERDQVDALLEADDGRVPLLALNHPEPKTLARADSFRFGLLPEEEGAFAAERLVAEGTRRVAVFGVNEEWSERAMAAFDAQLRALGGQISGRRMLRDVDVDFADAIAALIGPPDAAGDRRIADAVFIATRAPTARLLVPQLRASGFASLPMVATSHVYVGSPQALADKDLDGLVFLDAPWTQSNVVGLPARSELARDLPSAAASPRLFAFGIDAYLLLPYLDHLRARPGRYLDGASGTLMSDAFGRIRRLPQLYRFSEGIAQPATALALTADPTTESAPAQSP